MEVRTGALHCTSVQKMVLLLYSWLTIVFQKFSPTTFCNFYNTAATLFGVQKAVFNHSVSQSSCSSGLSSDTPLPRLFKEAFFLWDCIVYLESLLQLAHKLHTLHFSHFNSYHTVECWWCLHVFFCSFIFIMGKVFSIYFQMGPLGVFYCYKGAL